jgi:hypothetical protein
MWLNIVSNLLKKKESQTPSFATVDKDISVDKLIA